MQKIVSDSNSEFGDLIRIKPGKIAPKIRDEKYHQETNCAANDELKRDKAMSNEMHSCLDHIACHDGTITRQTGGFWCVDKSELTYGKETIRALVQRKKLEYCAWKMSKNGQFPIRAQIRITAGTDRHEIQIMPAPLRPAIPTTVPAERNQTEKQTCNSCRISQGSLTLTET